MVLRGVVFDLFGTLIAGWGEQTAADKIGEVAEILGVDVPRFRELMNTTYTLRADGQFGDPAEMLQRLCAMIDEYPSAELVQRAAAHRIAQFRNVLRDPLPEVRSLLAVLRDRQIGIGLISDCSGETPELWGDLDWTAPIQAPIFSYSEGVRKPDGILYRRVCDRLELAPHECLYVGDGGSHELTGALRAGMIAYQFKPTRPDGQRGLQYDPEPDWRGPSVPTLSAILPLLTPYRPEK
ncbi:MAG: HAD family hydrolase [Candidatus Dormiibacterota bacterium]